MFEKHLQYLTRKYNLISLPELSDALQHNNFSKIPRYAMVITVDDGWKENYALLPIIRKYKFRPTIFLVSHLINTSRQFWWTICKSCEIKHYKMLPNKQRLKELKDKYQYYPEKEYQGQRQALNYSEIEQMKDHVDFGLHTCYHPILTKCSEDEIRQEIIECKVAVEQIVGKEISSFCFPNGIYDESCINILKEYGLKNARTTDVGWNGLSTNSYKLKVTGVSDNGSLNKLIAELTGIPLFFQFLFYGGAFRKRKFSYWFSIFSLWSAAEKCQLPDLIPFAL
jgi:peptidoglycan/xylan/chitin deacetylase (PgdA/CDA1 family)